tara:strand:+ start:498 stop:686 length:189 start_codon:yes stop_codon:yes gene_type:complete
MPKQATPTGKRDLVKKSKSPEEIDAIVAEVVRNKSKYGLAVPGYITKLKGLATRRKKVLKKA